jgi:hypothetical protein
VELHVKVNADVATRVLGQLSKGQMRAALNRALNRAAKSTRDLASKTVRADLNVKAATVKSRVSLRTASGNAQQASVRIEGRSILLSGFIGTRETKRGLSVKIFKRGQRKVIKGAFTFPSGGAVISAERERVGGKRVPRLPIKALYGIGVAQFLSKPAVLEKLKEHGAERFRIEFERDLVHRLARARAGGSGPILLGPS